MQWFAQILALPRQAWALFCRWSRAEIVMLVAALVVLGCVFCFIRLADEVKERDTQTIDERILRSLRRVDDPSIPIGPQWLRDASLDVTSLGSTVVVLLIALGVSGLMWLEGQIRIMILTLLATSTGGLVALFLKNLIGRDRPTVVPHLRDVTSMSFPSGHAMISAIVFLTLGILLAQTVQTRAAKIYCLFCAMFLAFIVGISRIYLGVHYPTDVLAGWMAGTAWALICWMAIRYGRGSSRLQVLK